jgi:tetratricopeptide (TPR) repeat protein
MAYVGIAKLVLGADAEALTWLGHSIEANRNYPMAHFHLAAALALRGSLQEAQAAVQAGLALDPNFTIRRWRAGVAAVSATSNAERERILEAMRLAGAPEG